VTGIAFGFPKGGPIKQNMPLGANRSTVFFISPFAYKNKIFDASGKQKTPTFVRAFFALRSDRILRSMLLLFKFAGFQGVLSIL